MRYWPMKRNAITRSSLRSTLQLQWWTVTKSSPIRHRLPKSSISIMMLSCKIISLRPSSRINWIWNSRRWSWLQAKPTMIEAWFLDNALLRSILTWCFPVRESWTLIRLHCFQQTLLRRPGLRKQLINPKAISSVLLVLPWSQPLIITARSIFHYCKTTPTTKSLNCSWHTWLVYLMNSVKDGEMTLYSNLMVLPGTLPVKLLKWLNDLRYQSSYQLHIAMMQHQLNDSLHSWNVEISTLMDCL